MTAFGERTAQNFTYAAKVARVIDGDTIIADVSVGFRLTATLRLRLAGINAPEIGGSTHPAGDAAKRYAEEWLANHVAGLVVRTTRADDYGRYLATIYGGTDPVSLNEALLNSKNAVVYPAKAEG